MTTSLTGRVVRKRLSAGSKSEHEALVLQTPDGAEYALRRQDGNPFNDPVLDPLEGRVIACEGRVREGLVILISWKIVS